MKVHIVYANFGCIWFLKIIIRYVHNVLFSAFCTFLLICTLACLSYFVSLLFHVLWTIIIHSSIHLFLIFNQLCFNYTVGDSYIASGGIDGEVKLWTTNGENVGSWSHKSIVSALKVFKDDLGGTWIPFYTDHSVRSSVTALLSQSVSTLYLC